MRSHAAASAAARERLVRFANHAAHTAPSAVAPSAAAAAGAYDWDPSTWDMVAGVNELHDVYRQQALTRNTEVYEKEFYNVLDPDNQEDDDEVYYPEISVFNDRVFISEEGVYPDEECDAHRAQMTPVDNFREMQFAYCNDDSVYDSGFSEIKDKQEPGDHFYHPKLMITVKLTVLCAKKIDGKMFEWERYQPVELSISCTDGEIATKSTSKIATDLLGLAADEPLLQAHFKEIEEFILSGDATIDDAAYERVLSYSGWIVTSMMELCFRYFHAIHDNKNPGSLDVVRELSNDIVFKKTNIKNDKWTLFARTVHITYSVDNHF